MTAQTGRSHAKHIIVKLDNSGGTLTDITAYVNSIGTVQLVFDTQDVTAFSDGVKNVVIGHPAAPLTIGGPFDTTSHAHMIAINGTGLPLSLDIQIGIRHAWEAGEPQFGISMSASSGYVMYGYTVDMSANTWSATLEVFGSVAPAWGTAAES